MTDGLEQEPKFKRFAEEVVLAAMVGAKYQVGNSPNQTIQVLKQMMIPEAKK